MTSAKRASEVEHLPRTKDVKNLKVEDVMTVTVHCATMDMSVRSIIKMLLTKNISGAPVIDQMDRVVSVISESDLIKFAALGGLDKPLSEFASKLPNSGNLVAVQRQDIFRDVFKQFLVNPVRRVLVLDSTGKIQGLVSRSNILRAFLSEEK